MKIAEVFVKQKNKTIDHFYDYLISNDLIGNVCAGVRVLVSFGSEKRILEGFVVSCKEVSDFSENLKPILQVIDDYPILTLAQIELCLWMKKRYFCLFYDALSLFTFPIKVVSHDVALDCRKKKYKVYNAEEKKYRLTNLADSSDVKGKKMQRVLELLRFRECSASELNMCLGNVDAARRSLEKKGLIETYKDSIDENNNKNPDFSSITLTSDENQLYQLYCSKQAFRLPMTLCHVDNRIRFFVYCKIVSDFVRINKQAVICIPEITMISGFEELFYQFFGNSCAMYYGKVKTSTRWQIFEKVRTGKIKVVLGTSAALFLPYIDLGIIIIDQPSDNSFVPLKMPYYDIFETAKYYSQLLNCQFITGNIIPTVKEYALNQQKKHFILSLERDNQPVNSIDMQEEIKNGNFRFLSHTLEKAIKQTIDDNEKCLLLLNSKYYAFEVRCQSCAYILRCEKCHVALRLSLENEMICPSCGRTEKLKPRCPCCGDNRLRIIGLGIEQIVEKLKVINPQWRILHIDADTIKNASDLKRINTIVKNKEWDIAVGTQMLLKGFHFSDVGLAGVVLADYDLRQKSYNTSENIYRLYKKFFSLGEKRFLQTNYPDNNVVSALANGDLHLFYRHETDYRVQFGYPPFGHLLYYKIGHTDYEIAFQDANRFYKMLTTIDSIVVHSPYYLGCDKKNNKNHFIIIVKTNKINDYSSKYEIIEKNFLNDKKNNKIRSTIVIALDIISMI